MKKTFMTLAATVIAGQVAAEGHAELHGALPSDEYRNNGTVEPEDYGTRDTMSQTLLEGYVFGTGEPSNFRIQSISYNHDIEEACYVVAAFQTPLMEVFGRADEIVSEGVACLPFDATGSQTNPIGDVGFYTVEASNE